MSGGTPLLPGSAYERWLNTLGGAGWPGAIGEPEQVAVGEALGRVTAAAVTARWPSPRCDCAAMDGIAVRAAVLAAAAAEAVPSVDAPSVSAPSLAARSVAAVDTAGRSAGEGAGAIRL